MDHLDTLRDIQLQKKNLEQEKKEFERQKKENLNRDVCKK